MRLLFAALALAVPALAADEGRNALEGKGRFLSTTPAPNPWFGVDDNGFLRKSVQAPGTNMFVSKSNQFTYAFLPNSASFVDMDADGLPDLIAPDGAGFFWFWKNTGKPGAPAFGFGEVMPLLVDNGQSTFAAPRQPHEKSDSKQPPPLTAGQLRDKEKVDKERERELQRLTRMEARKPENERRNEKELDKEIEAKFPYPWEQGPAAPTGPAICKLNAFRQLRAVAAPCDFDNNGAPDFLIGDSSGIVYPAKNSGKSNSPDFTTVTPAQRIPLKGGPVFDEVSRRSDIRTVEFLNYAMPFVCDWTGDGRPDLLLGEGTYSVNAIRLFSDYATMKPGDSRREKMLYVGEERTFLAPAAWDWDGDGFLDLLVTDSTGRLTIHPNPGGHLRDGNTEATELVEAKFGYGSLPPFACPQPCDWNNDGVMDLVFSGPDGRIFYCLGTARGSPEFSSPEAIRSSRTDDVPRIQVADHANACAVFADTDGSAGGTADAQTLYTSVVDIANKNGWPDTQRIVFGLQPPWSESELSTVFKPVRDEPKPPRPAASWAIAPVPFEIIEVVPAAAGDPGEGNTLRLTWHDPKNHAVFRKPRTPDPRFLPGFCVAFPASYSEPKWPVKDEDIIIRFQMRAKGRFTKLLVDLGTRFYNGNKVADGGTFASIEPPPGDGWRSYEIRVPPGKLPRMLPAPLYLRLEGSGEVWLRDVFLGTANTPEKNNQ